MFLQKNYDFFTVHFYDILSIIRSLLPDELLPHLRIHVIPLHDLNPVAKTCIFQFHDFCLSQKIKMVSLTLSIADQTAVNFSSIGYYIYTYTLYCNSSMKSITAAN